MNPNEILDKALDILRQESPPYDLTGIMLEFYGFEDEKQLNNISGDPFEPVLDKLVNDGYVNRSDSSSIFLISYYHITFDGRVFAQNGGYTRRFENENVEIAGRKTIAKYTLIGALSAGIATSIILLWDIIKYGTDHDWRIVSWMHLK